MARHGCKILMLFLALLFCAKSDIRQSSSKSRQIANFLHSNWASPLTARGGSIISSSVLIEKKKFLKQNEMKFDDSGINRIRAGDTQSHQLQKDPNIPMLIRVLFLTYYASLGALLPYLPVYYHSLGHGGLIIGLLGAVKPLTTFLVAPFWGIISDQSSNKFKVLYATFFVSLVGQLLVAFRANVPFLVAMVFVTAFFNAPVKSLIDSIVLDHLTDKSNYGKMRLWGQLGFGIGSSGAGILLSQSKGIVQDHGSIANVGHLPVFVENALQTLYKLWMRITGYKLLFFTHLALSVPCFMILRAFEYFDRKKGKIKDTTSNEDEKEIKKTEDSSRIKQGIQLLLTDGDALLFFFLVFVVGTSSGIIENFAYVRMREVGGTGKAMGLSRLVSSAAGAPMFWFSGPLAEKLGADRVLTLSLLSYVARFLIYACMRNPYHGLPAEALRGVTFAAFWSTGTIYAHRISPAGMSTTMLMFMNAMYGGLGQSLGAIIGGKLQHSFGTVKTFVYSAIFDFIFVIMVSIYLRFRKDSSFKNPKPIGAPISD